MPHGADLLRCLERVRSAQNTEESTSCTLSIKIEPDSRGSSPAMTERTVPTIYYIRHGETSWNAEGRLQGTRDVPLNDLGRRQAAQAGSILADMLARDGHD